MRYLLLTLTLLCGLALAQTETNILTLEEALAQAADNDAAVLSARSDLQAAERELERVQADPLALRLTLVQAEQGLTNAQNALEGAVLAAETEVAEAYFAALQAQDDLALAQLAESIAQTTLEATRIRFEAGAATQLDLTRADNDLAAAQRQVQDAEASSRLALNRLASLIGISSEGLMLAEVQGVPEVPELSTVQGALDENAQLTQARQALETAKLELAAKDNAFSSQAEIERARNALESAQRQLSELQRSLELTFRQSYNGVLGAQARLQNARAAQATAQETLNAQELRYEAGSISELELMQARLDYAEAEAQAAAALHGLRQALLQLEQTVLGASRTTGAGGGQ